MVLIVPAVLLVIALVAIAVSWSYIRAFLQQNVKDDASPEQQNETAVALEVGEGTPSANQSEHQPPVEILWTIWYAILT